MATTCITNAYRQGCFQADMDYTNVIKMALYNNSGHLQTTGAYTVTNEVTGTGYVAKGNTLAGATLAVDSTNHVVYLDFTDTEWTSSTITATDCMIFDETATSPSADPSMYIGDFNGSKSTNGGTFTVEFPGAAYNTAIIRFA